MGVGVCSRRALEHEVGHHWAWPLSVAGETSDKIAHAKAVAAEARDTATHVQSQLQNMYKNVERWQSQLQDLRGQDLGQVERDASSSGERVVLAFLGAKAWETNLSAHFSCSVHPGEDIATAAGQTEPSGKPSGA